jgi:hypothetical protein
MTFLIGVGLAVVLAIGAFVGLNAAGQSTSDAFYTRYTVPLGHDAETQARQMRQQTEEQRRSQDR